MEGSFLFLAPRNRDQIRVEGNPWRCHSIQVESVPILPYKDSRDAGQFSWCIYKSGLIDKGGVPKAKQAVSAEKKALRLSENGRLLVH